MLWYRSPLTAPPISMKTSTSPSRSQSPQATPCPFWRWPVPDVPVISAKRSPPTFLNIRFGISVAKFGSPVPRYMSRKPSLSKSPKLLPIVANTMSRPASLSLVLEALATQVAEQPVGMSGVRLADQALDDVADRAVVAGGEDIEPAVVVVVPGPAREAVSRAIDPHRQGDVAEGPVAVVAIQLGGPAQVVEEQVGIVVVVEVDPVRPLADERGPVLAEQAGPGGDLLEGAVLPVVIEPVWAAARSRRTGRASRRCRSRPMSPRSELTGCSSPASRVTSVNVPSPLLRSRLGRMAYGNPGARGDVDVHESVVVVIGLDAVQAAELAGHAGGLAAVLERPVPLVPVHRHVLGGIRLVTATSSRPSLSKSSMIAPPAWLKRLTPVR